MTARTLLECKSGTVLAGRYALHCVLGKGSFGVVYGAVELKERQKVAVKLVPGGTVTDRDRKEIAIMQSIVHCNIVRLLDVLDGFDPLGIVMELCPSDLFDRIELCGWFGEDETRHYARMLFAGLEAIHSAGIAHRDIKPENLLLDSCGILKISDFGLSSSCMDSENNFTLFHQCCGTMQYVPPEALAGLPYNGFSGDLWASGVVLFIMLLGRFPFAQASLECEHFASYLTRHTLPLPEGASMSLQSLLLGLLRPEAAERLTLETIMKHPWINNEDPIVDIVLDWDSVTEDEAQDLPMDGIIQTKSAEPMFGAAPLPLQPLVKLVGGPTDSEGVAARIDAEERDLPWEHVAPQGACDADGLTLVRTDFKKKRAAHRMHLRLHPPAALDLIAEVAEKKDFGVLANIHIEEVTINHSEQSLTIVGCCGEEVGDLKGRTVHVHAQAQVQDELVTLSGAEPGPGSCTMSFSRYQGDTLSFQAILLALKSNVAICAHLSSGVV